MNLKFLQNIVRWLFSTNQVLRLFLLLLGSIFGRFLGSEGSAIMTTRCSLYLALLVLSLVMAFPYFSFRLKGKGPLKRILYIFLVFSVGFVGSLIRIHVLAGFGTFSSDVLTVFMGTFYVSGSSGGMAPHGYQGEASSYSELFTYTSDMEESATSSSSVNQPSQREQAAPSNTLPAPAPAAQQPNHLNQPFGEGGEREARAQEHARISAEVEAITSSCENLEAAMVRKAHVLLHQRGVTLDDQEDVRRALQLTLHDDWEHDIDDRKRHFTVLRRNFGTTRCERWNTFIDSLRGLGNHHINARHYVD